MFLTRLVLAARKFQQWSIAQFAFGLLNLLKLFPADGAMNFADRFARFVGPRTKRHVLTLTNLRNAFPEKSEAEIEAIALESWGNNCYHTYAVLRERAALDALQSKSAQFFEDRFSAGSSSVRGFTAVPITDIHLHSAREGEIRVPGSATTIYTFAAIAVFILLIACINFTNLATARAAQRAKEIGVRKAAGSARRQLIAQFLGESLLVAVLASALATALVVALLPPFASFVEREIGWRDLASPGIVTLILLTTLIVGLMAGSYPAFFLSAFNPVRVLKGDVARGGAAVTVRKALLVLQFAISITLAVATLVVLEQARFARAFELGYNKDQVVVLSGVSGRGVGPQWEAMKRQWLELPEVRAVSASNVTPGTRSGVRTLVKILARTVTASSRR